MSASQFNANVNRYAGLSPEQVVLALAIELGAVQLAVQGMVQKLDRIAESQVTASVIADLSKQLADIRIQTEGKIRPLEDWKTSIMAQIKFAYAFAALMATLAGIVGHYWK